jgi:ATP-dependent Clp protease protease subunit
MKNNFDKFAKSRGISSLALHNFNKSKNSSLLSPKAFTPNIIEERQLNVSVLDVFSRLMMDRIIFLGEEIDDYVANIINAQLLFLDTEENSEEPIWLYINSPGGDCYSGLAIYDTMQAIKASVYTNVMGMAASMAFILAISGEKKHRYAMKHSRLMLHQPLGGIPFSQATDIEIYNKEMQTVKIDLINIVAKHTGQPTDKIICDMERDNWMNTTVAKDYGAIDKILLKTK